MDDGSIEARTLPAGTPAAARYWFVHRNGGRQLIDPAEFDLAWLAAQAERRGGRIVREEATPAAADMPAFEPPVSALGPMFRGRLGRMLTPRVAFDLQVSTRATNRVLGGYYSTRRLIRIYSHDRETGRRPFEELFDTFLHEVAHHLEYTEPETFGGRACGRVPGRMHSRLFWRILGDLKARWIELQARG